MKNTKTSIVDIIKIQLKLILTPKLTGLKIIIS